MDFYDVFLYNSDSISVSEEYNQIAEKFFRIDENRYDHSRNVYTLMDLLGDFGGIA